jgi:hypothetical protein
MRVVPRRRSLKLHLTAGLAALLLLTQIGTLAHAVGHDADKLDTSCALCLFAAHPSGPPPSACVLVDAGVPEFHVPPVSLPAQLRQEFRANSVRGPPIASEI